MLGTLMQLQRYRKRPQNFWSWWRSDCAQSADVRKAYMDLTENVMPRERNGNPHRCNLKISNDKVPLMSWTDPVNTLAVGIYLMKKRQEIPPSSVAADLTCFLRGDGVVDGWTKVYHVSWLVADVEHPRRPDNCLDFIIGDVDEGNTIHWGVIHERMRLRLDLARQQVKDTLIVGDGAFLLTVATGFTHGETSMHSAFNQPGYTEAQRASVCCVRVALAVSPGATGGTTPPRPAWLCPRHRHLYRMHQMNF